MLRVLVVEDSEFYAQMVTSLVRKSGVDVISERVETAEQLENALRAEPLARNSHPEAETFNAGNCRRKMAAK